VSGGREPSVGVLFPRRLLRPCLWHLCRLSLLRGIVARPSPCLRAVASSSRELSVPLFPREEAAKAAVTTDSWKPMTRDVLRCLPPTRTLRRIRWPLQPRSHDRHTAFGECDDRWATFRRRPGSSPIVRRISATYPEHQRSFRRTRRLTLACQIPWRLGPRSLLPPLFLERCVRAYSRPGCCLPTSATAYDVRALSTGLSFPRRDGGHDHLPLLTHHARPPQLPAERWHAASRAFVRSLRPRCRFLLLTQVCPTAIPKRPPHLEMLAHRESSGDRRARVSGPSEGRVLERGGACWASTTSSAYACADADDVPLLLVPEGTCCRRCDRLHGNEPRCSRVGPT